MQFSSVLPGDRAVARVRDVVLVVDAPALGAPPQVWDLTAALERDDASLSSLASVQSPAFAAVEVTESGLHAVLRGGNDGAADTERVTVAVFGAASATTPTETLRAGDTFTDQALPLPPGAVVTVTVGPPPPPGPVCGPTALHLLRGAVPGAGVVLWSDAAQSPTDMTGLPGGAADEEPTDAGALFAATEHEATAARPPQATGPIVEGRRCAFGHLNPPTANYCTRCGALVDPRGPLEFGPRPPLGVLIADDGGAYVVESDMVIGREPAAYVAHRGGRSFDGRGVLAELTLDDRTGALSRAHLELRIDGWQLLVIDIGSANGTWLRPPGAPIPMRIPPGQPIALTTGVEIYLGGRMLRLSDSALG